MSDGAHPLQDSAIPRDPSGPAIVPTATRVTRRTLLQKISEWASKGAILKEVVAAAGGVTSGGVAVYHYFEPRIKVLSEKDFVIGHDVTDVSLDNGDPYVKVRISRRFTQQATKTGYYNYQRVCEGNWIASECSMTLQRRTGSTEPVELATGVQNQSGEVLSVIEPRNGKSIHIEKEDSLIVGLVSEERIERVKGGYRLRLNAQFTESSFTLHAASATSGIECLVYAEKQGRVLQHVILDKALMLNRCTNGLEYLISWS